MSDVIVRPLSREGVEEAVSLYEAVATEGRWIGREAPIDRDESQS